MAITTTVVNGILTALHPTSSTATIGTLTITYPISVRLMTANGNAGTGGTELGSGGDYVAATGMSVAGNWATASAGSQSTNAAVSQANMPAATVVGIELWDNSGTAQRLEYGSMTSKTTQAGDTLTFTSGAITSAIS
jgi:L-alanine-DL-glutamate epimerase-like enolase superfamily enzyme